MQTITANEAKTHFGELLLRSQREPVQVSKNGKPVAVMISAEAYAELDAMKKRELTAQAERGLGAIEAGDTVDGEEFFRTLLKA